MINGALVVINRLIKRSGGWIEAYKVLPRNFSILDMEIGEISKPSLQENAVVNLIYAENAFISIGDF